MAQKTAAQNVELTAVSGDPAIAVATVGTNGVTITGKALGRTEVLISDSEGYTMLLMIDVVSKPLDEAGGEIPGLVVAPMVAAGAAHNVALKANGSVWAWLGHGADRQPVKVMEEGTATWVAAGNDFSAAVGVDGQVYIWGTDFADGARHTVSFTSAITGEAAQIGMISVSTAATGVVNNGLGGNVTRNVDWHGHPYGRILAVDKYTGEAYFVDVSWVPSAS